MDEEIEFVDKHEDDTWSASKLKTISSCGHQFYYRYRTDIQGTQTPYLSFGKAVHATIEKIHQANDFSEEFWQDTWADQWLANIKDVDFTGYFQDFRGNGMKMVLKYVKKNKDIKILELESPFPNNVEVYKVGQYVVRGVIDQVRRMDDGRLLVVDLKTQKYPPDPMILRADPQFTIYHHVAKQKYPGENPLMALYHLESGTMFYTERTDNDIHEVEAMIREGQQKVDLAMFERNVGHGCRYCPYLTNCLEDYVKNSN